MVKQTHSSNVCLHVADNIWRFNTYMAYLYSHKFLASDQLITWGGVYILFYTAKNWGGGKILSPRHFRQRYILAEIGIKFIYPGYQLLTTLSNI